MNLRDFWYVAAESAELRRNALVARSILDEAVVLFRDERGEAVALEDCCLHRNAPLSAGKVERGQVRCGYHGWLYEPDGRVAEIPSLPVQRRSAKPCVRTFPVREQEGYVYVRLSREPEEEHAPAPLPMYGDRRYARVRLVHAMRNTVTNCAENFVDVPHTAYVHPVTFRAPRKQELIATVTRDRGTVTVTYANEVHRGAFSWFLNPQARSIEHTDRFLMPNVTSVEYRFGPKKHLFITSHSVPSSTTAPLTTVYTDVAFHYGLWTRLATPFVRRRAKKIIAEDVAILARQAEVLARLGGPRFHHSPIDLVHLYIESIREELEQGRDPRALPRESREVAFVV